LKGNVKTRRITLRLGARYRRRPDYRLYDIRGICVRNFIRASIRNRRTLHCSAKSKEDTDSRDELRCRGRTKS